MQKLLLSLILLCFYLSSSAQIEGQEYLQKVAINLNTLQSVSYQWTIVSSAPGDTTKFSKPRTQFIRAFANPSDTIVGVSTAIYASEAFNEMTDFYDGLVRGQVNWEKQRVKVDSFQNHPYPFRLVHYPFYWKVKEMINYALSTDDVIETGFKDYGDSIHFSLKIIDQHVYFHLKPVVIQNDYIPLDEVSQFDIWINKSDLLPYRMRSKWSHNTTFEYCAGLQMQTNKQSFIARDFFPKDFAVNQFVRPTSAPKSILEGKVAPDWELKDIHQQQVHLKDLESKVLLLEFTGVGCGPCHQALPFLKQLANDYKNKDFELISIETWSDNLDGLIRYHDKNKMNYKFLMADEKVKQAYKVRGVPAFFILDKNRIIQKVISGYRIGSSDQEILKVINKFL
ncbi:MAG: TlpA disulfide reductase family protein [Bacteroidota bacterium]